MKKRLCALLVLLTLALPLLGCHGSRELNSFTMPEEFDENTPVEIMFWSKNDSNKTQTDIYQKAIADFEALYPNVTVNIRLYTDYARIYNDVITNIATQTTPDVCITYPDHIATYLTGDNVVLPMGDFFDDPRYGLGGSALKFDGPTREEIIPQFLSECQIGDTFYALPYMRSTEACYVNKTYVEKLGFTLPEELTWDFVWEVSEAAMAKDADGNFAVNGQKVMIPFIYKSTDNMMIQMLQQRGESVSTPEGEVRLFNDTTREILNTVAGHVKNGAFSTFKISSYPANFLNAGQCIFAIDSTAGATWMGTHAPLLDISADKLVEFETAVMTIPQYDTAHPVMISQGPSVCVFNKPNAQQTMAAWLFAQFLLTNDVQIPYAETEGYVPVTSKAQSDEGYRDYLRRSGEDAQHYEVKIQASELLMAHTGDTFTTPVFNGSASLRDASGQLIEEVTKSVRRKETVDAAYIENLFDKVTALYRLDEAGAHAAAGESGPLPATAKALLWTLAAAWLGMGIWTVYSKIRHKKR